MKNQDAPFIPGMLPFWKTENGQTTRNLFLILLVVSVGSYFWPVISALPPVAWLLQWVPAPPLVDVVGFFSL